MKLYNYQKEDYGTLLGADVLDASKGALYMNVGLQPENTNRTILIGIGGTGVQTVDFVKGEIQKRLNPTWRNCVAFIGMDTSWTELNGAVYLDEGEKIMYTLPGASERMSDPATYPAAVRPFMPEGERLGYLDSDGAGRTRLVGKVKIHDQAPGNKGADEQIVQKLSNIKSSMLPLSKPGGKYEVYVIGSACGGTCSGGFLELPALIRQVFPASVTVNGMLYLPDTLISSNVNESEALQANGYATLKELNYYMGMYMRPAYAERWTYNNPANPVLEHKSQFGFDGFIDVPYLIGTTNGTSHKAFDNAKECISEFLISLLAKMPTNTTDKQFLTSAFMSNALSSPEVTTRLYMANKASDLEAANEFHEFPKRFAAIGFARAAVPQKLIRAYEVGRLCKTAGLRPVEAAERAQLVANGAVVLPFKHENDLMNALEGTAKARELLNDIEATVGRLNSVEFTIGQISSEDVTFENIQDGHFDTSYVSDQAIAKVAALSDPASMAKIEQDIQESFQKFRESVKTYVKAEGPMAFWNLYTGRFSPVGTNYGVGIKKMLDELVNGKQFVPENDSFRDLPFFVLEAAKTALTKKKEEINHTSRASITNIFGLLNQAKRHQLAAQWKTAYQNRYKAEVVDKRKKSVLNQNGSLKRSFADPVSILADEIRSFGCILETMTNIYEALGKPVDSFDTFQRASDGQSELNIAGINQSAYNWIKQQADASVEEVNAVKFREELIDEYFNNMEQWQEVPDERVTITESETIKLTAMDLAVPAREAFDRYISNHYAGNARNISILDVLIKMNDAGLSFNQAANTIIRQLSANSRPQFNGDIPGNRTHSYIMLPNALSNAGVQGKQVDAALRTEADNVVSGIDIYASDADSIAFYQIAAPLEIYRLKDLKEWENHYENGDKGISNRQSYLHGLSPDVRVESKPGRTPEYIETMPWKDYPSITRQNNDPRLPDPATGYISREGKLRIALDKEIEHAKELGVLYSERDSQGGWIVKRVFCHRQIINWQFDILRCTPDKNGFLPTGKSFAAEVARQNGTTLEAISRQVYLESSGGVMDKEGHPTEDLAWKYAARTLRAHVPMYIEVRETVKKLEPWVEQIKNHNIEIEQRFRPGKMIHMITAGLLRRQEDKSWILDQQTGTRMIANITDDMLRYTPRDKQYVENGLLAYYLYTKLEGELSNDEFQNEYLRAKGVHAQLVKSNDTVALEEGLDQAKLLLDEIEALRANGAVLLDKNQPKPARAFKQKYAWLSEEELQKIQAFYCRLGLWVNL